MERDIQQLLQSTENEVEERLRIAREELTAEHEDKVEQSIEEAKRHWEEEQEEERFGITLFISSGLTYIYVLILHR